MCGRRRLSPPRAARVVASPLLLIAVVLLLACAPGAGDAPASGAATSPSGGGAPPPAAGTRPGADGASPAPPLSPLADSLASAEARFDSARSSVNRDAAALDARAADRFTPDYAKAYDELRRRTLAAESLRAHRDALRTRLRRAASAAAARP